MKHLLRTFLVLAIFTCFTTEKVEATHIAAADVYYEYLAPLQYKVHLILYRRCNPGSAGLGSTAFMSARDSSCGSTNIGFTVDTAGTNDPFNGQPRHSVCTNLVPGNPCTNNAGFTIYEYWHYAGDVTLPYVCTDWRFLWASCCRNTTTNLVGQPGTVIHADLNNTVRPNNSVVLTAEPIPYVCNNQPFQYLNSPIDPDLDSFVFTATTPMAGGFFPTVGVAYQGAYTATAPLATTPVGAPGYVVDALTGTINFTPNLTGQFVLAFTATEYDPVTAQKVGVIKRDVQINVVGCTTVPPIPTPVGGVPGPPNAVIRNLNGAIDLSTPNSIILGVCPGETMSFEVEATGDTANNLVKTYSNNAITAINSTYTSNPLGGGNPVTGSFGWTPTAAQIGNHVVVLFFIDSTCTNGQPIILNSKVTVLIKVLRGVDAGPDLPICAIGDSIILPALGPEDITQWNWSELGVAGQPHGMGATNVQNPYVRPNRTTTYVVTTNGQTACKNTDTITVYIDTAVTVQGAASPAILCEPGLTSLSATPFGPPPSYFCGQENVPCAGASAAAPFGVGGVSSFGVTPFNGSQNGARCQLIYTAAELAAAGWTGPRRIDSLSFDIINKTSIGTYNMEIKMGCTFVSDIQQFIPSGLIKKVFEDEAYLTTAGKNTFNFQTPYIWDGVSNLVVDVCFYNLNGVGIDAVASTSTAPNNQYIGSTSLFAGCQIPDVQSALPTISTNRPNIEMYACDMPTTPWQFQWSGPYVFDSTVQNAQAFVNDNPATYRVFTMGGNGCLVWDDVDVTLGNHDVEVSPTQETICLNDRVRVTATGIGNAPSESFQWFVDGNSSLTDLSCTTCAIPEITPKTTGIHVYTVVRTDSYGCTDSADIVVNVLTLPTITITNGDSAVVRYGEDLQLIAEGGIKYSWSPSWGMNNPNISSPVIRPSETTTYTVVGIDDNGCGNQDQILVKVDFAHNLFIPTAFSPNGDGNNDVFRIANFGFQRVSEFRVFNRWGQQVFYANDNGGWDGTFKGTDQDAGTYYYVIKGAFADGHVETFKGDVILVR